MSGGAGPLVPTFQGFVQNSMDGLILFEACLCNKLHYVPRRPHDRERTSLIKSGSVFIYEENASGIKRWTDGVAWSPSRILGNFLIYRELEKPFPPGEKKKANKRKRTSLAGEPYPRRDSADTHHTNHLPTPLTPPIQENSIEVKSEGATGTDQEKDLERSLIGSLVDSYGFRPDGLVKKTMSINYNGVMHHMVSYYKVEDVKNNLLPRPIDDTRLANIHPRAELYMKQNFRAPIEEMDPYSMEGQMHPHAQMMYSPMHGAQYAVRAQHAYYQTPSYHQMYSLPPSTSTTVYGALTAPAWSTQQSPTTTSGHAATWSAPQSSAGASSSWTGQQQSATPSATSTQPSWAPQHSPNPAAAAGTSSSWSAPHASPNPASAAQSTWNSAHASPNPAASAAAQSSWAAPPQTSPNTTHAPTSWPPQQQPSPNPNAHAATAQWTAQQASGGGASTAWSWPAQPPAPGTSAAQWAQQSPRTVDASTASGSATTSWARPTQPAAAAASNAWSTPTGTTGAPGTAQWHQQNTARSARAYP